MLPFLRSQLHKFCFSTSGVCEAAAFFLVLLYQVSFAQTTYTWVPTGGGSWTSATNWSPNGVPSDGDDVIIPAGHTGGTINNVPAVTLRDLVVNGTGNCVFQASASVNTVSVDRTFSVVAGKTLTLGQAGGRINFTLNASAQGAVYGTVRLNASGATDRFFTNNGDLSIYPGGLVDGTGESNFITTAGSTLRIGSPQGITLSAAAGSIQMSGTPTNRTYSTDANYVYIGNANQAVGNGLPVTVNSLTIQNTGTAGNNTVTLASSITVTNALTVTSGVLAIGANNINGVGSVILNGTTITGSGTINLNGDVTTLAAGTTAVINPPVNLGTASRTFTVNDSPVNPDLILNNVISGSGGLLKNGNGALTLTGSNTFSGGLTLNTGALNINHANALGNTLGAFTINGGTVNNTSGAAITTANYTINWNGDFTFSGSNDLNLGTGTVAVSGNRVVTTSAGILTFGGVINAPGASLTKNGSGTLSFGSNAVTLNAFTVNAGTLVSSSGTLTLSGSFLVAGTFLHNNGTVHYNGGATQQLAGVNYFNLQLSNSGQKNAVGAVNVSNNLVNTSVLDMAGFTLTAGGTVSNSGGTVRFAGPANGLAIGSGTVEYYGASQTVDSGIYENLIINQSSGEAVPDGDVTVNGVLTLSNGRLNLAGNILYLGSSASVSVASPSSSRMIIATGGGEVIKTFSTAGSFTFPIGDNTGAYDYAPITVNVTSASGFPGNVSASVDDFKHPNNASTTHFLTRYWSVNTTLTAVTANVAAVYPSADINGTEANIRAARLSGGFNQVSNPWVKFAALGGNTLNASGTPLLNGVVNVFTGIRGADPTVTISGGGITICQGTSVNLSTAATADPAILYEWSPAAGLSATNVPDPIASPTVTTTYTVTIRDGNGITGSDNTTITVNPKPATPVVTPAGPVEACTGTAPLVLTSNAPSGNQWYRNGLPLPGETSTTLTLPTAPASNGSYSVVSTVSGCASDESNIVNVTITPAPTVNAGSDAETCQGVTFNFSSQATPASASNYSSILWTHTGTGTLTNATTLTPTYTPGAGETGAVTFTLTANGNGSCAPVNDQMILTITPAPAVNAGSDAETCQGVTFNFSSQVTPASASNYSSILWTHTGTGTLTNATTLTPTYTPGAGETGPVTFTLTANGNGSCAPVNDQMILTITPAPVVNAGSDAETCQGVTFNFSSQVTPASASNYSSILWTHTGTGTLTGATTLTPVYTPGAGETGAVTFTLTANGNGSCAPVNDAMILTITPAPVVNAGSDAETCQGVTFNFSSQATPASASNYSSILWTHTGTGTLTNATTLTPTYTPGAGETGPVTFTLTANGNGSCAPVNDQMILTITPAPVVNAGSDAETCQGVTFNFSSQATPASATNYASLLWTHTGTGTLFNANTLTPTYFPGAGETGAVTFTLTANGNGSCAPVNDQMILTITPAPVVNAGSDAETCQGVTFNFSSQATPASASNYSSILWTHTGTGTLTNATTLTPTYTPGAGETGPVTFTLTANGNGSCAPVNDQMVLTITPAPVVNAGSDAETCQGVTFNFSSQVTPASATNYASLLWTHTGTGTLFNANTLTPTYFPGAGETGAVTFTLTANGNGSCAPVNDAMILTITPAPVVNAGSDAETCQGVTFNFSSQVTPASASNYSSILWTHTGTGTLTNATTLTPTYTPGAGETGSVTFTLTANGNGSCAPVNDQMILTITPAPVVNAGSDAETCQGVTFNFSSQVTPASATNYASLLWTHTGTGTLFNANTLTPTYQPGAGETGAVTFTLTANGNGSCAPVNDQMVLTITPAPVVNAGSDAETCQGVTFNFSSQSTPASATNYASLLWTHTGTGTLTGATTLTPVYTPGAGETGPVTFTLTANGNGSCAPVNDAMILTITPAPTVNAGSDAETCQGVTFNFSSQATPASASNYSSILWTHTGTGTLTNATTLTPTYTPGAGETGAVTFTLTANGNGSCAPVNDQMILTITPAPAVNAGSDAETCQGVTFNFSSQVTPASASNYSSILWTHTGTGTLTNATTLTPTYTPGAGETGPVTFTLTANGNGSCAPVNDQMILTITPAPVVNAGSDAETCQGVTFNFSSQVTPASASNYSSILWTHTGTGTLTGATTLTPVYTPGAGETGAVTFTLTANGNGSCAPVNDAMILTITPAPVVNAGSDAETCQGVTFNFSSQVTPASASNYSSILWTHTGTGTLTNATTLTPTYTPGAGETGSVTFTLTANGNGSCAPVNDQMILTITPAPVVNAGSDAETCQGVTFNFSSQATPASATNYASLLWTHTGTGTLFNANTLTPTYFPGAGETGAVTFTLTANGNGSCAPVNDQMILTITPAPVVNAGSDAETCQGVTFNFSSQATPASAANYSTILWTHSGTGTLTNATTLTPTYTPGAGETGPVTFTLTANGNGSCAPVNDQMILTITPAPVVNAGSDAETCQGVTFNFSSQATPASATNYASLLWTHTGTGTLFNANTLTPTYQPGAGETGAVTFTLTANGNGSCAPVNDAMILTITPAPVVNAGSDAETCQGVTFNFSSQVTPASASNYSSILWTHTGTGTLTNATTLTPTYTPGAGETGSVTFTLTANGNGSCAPVNDQMILTITPAPVVNAGSDAETCQGVTFNFSSQATPASATNYASLLWTHTGTGTLFNANTLTPTYFPGTGETGPVTFTLTANGNGSCAPVNDQMILTITPAPVVNAGSDAETCQGVTFNFSSQATPASAANYSTILWTHSGTGTLTNATTLTPTYTPGAGETGPVTFTLTANGNGSCAPVNDQMILTITPAPVVNAGSDAETCQGVTFNFSSQATPASATNYASLLWTHTGTGTLFNANTLTPTYQPGAGETGAVTFTLTANGNGSCAPVNDQMILTITPAPVVNAGSDAETCQGVTFNFSSQVTPASASNYSSILWTHTGMGTLTGATTLTPTYTPGAGETGPVTFTLTANGNGSCAPANDQMVLTITPAPTVNAGSDAETCQGVTFNFSSQVTPASATNYASLLWTHTGTGTLFNANTLTPTYQPGAGETGAVTFTLTANGNGSCAPVNDQMILTITPAPVVNAGSDAETCQGVTFNFSSQATPASASNYSSILWTHTGTGTLTNATTLTPTYTPGAGETGSVTFTLTANGNGSCAPVNDQMVLTITPAPTVNAGSDAEICQGGNFAFSSQLVPASAANYSSLLWTHTGSGTLFNANTLTPTYFASPLETGTVSFILTAFGNGSCVSVNDMMDLLITPAPIANAGSNDAVCEGTASFDFATRALPASFANGSVSWSHTGSGSLSNPSDINPVYTVNASDVSTTITFTLTVTSPSSVCAPSTSQFILQVNRAAQVSVPIPVTTVCEPQKINLSGFIGGSASSGSWSLITGGGSLSVSSITGLNVTAVYDTVRADVGNTLVFRLTSNDPDGTGPCVPAYADQFITVEESPKVFAGNDFQVCEYEDINLNGSFGGSASSVTWSGGVPAQYDNINNPITTYNLSSSERSASNLVLTFTLTTNDPPGVCPAVSDNVVVSVRDTLSSVAFTPVLASVYAENDPPVDLTFAATPLGGVYSGPGVSGMFFYPSIANITPQPPNRITYTYQDPATGCFSAPSKLVIVNPITDVSFVLQGERVDGSGNAHICANTGDVRLIEIPDVDIPALVPPENAVFDSPDLPLGKIIFDGTDFRLRTNGLTPGTYRIRYTFTNSLGASNTVERFVVIDPAPKAIIDVTNSCITDLITFEESSAIFGTNPSGAFINQWLWEFGDGNGSTSQEPTYQYITSGTYNVQLRVTTNEGCQHDTVKVLRVGPVPQMAFTWSEFCNGNDTKFTDLTDPGISTIIKYTWQFGDTYSVTNDVPGEAVTDPVPPLKNNGGRTGGTFRDPSHRYDLFGQYDVTLTVETNDGCINSLTQRAFILSYGTPSPSSAYFEDFEAGPGTWVATRVERTVPTDTSWIFGLPSGAVINSASSGTNAWWTGGNPNSGIGQDRSTYYNNEKSAVIGPCLNLTAIKRPMISLDYWSDVEGRFDGAVLQFSTDGGQTWQSIGDDGGAGINWYNGRALTGNPGNQVLGQFGWTNRQGGWKTARYNLDMIPVSERDEVIFRVAFGSNNDNGLPPSNVPYEGFAFDNVFIGEKQRNVLVEYFTNAGISPITNDYLNNLYANQFTFKDSSDFFKIQYHIGNPAPDPINQANPGDPAARALLYGVSQPPIGIMDGILYNHYGTVFNGDQTKITAVTVDRRALEDPRFRIGVQIMPTNDPVTNDSLHVVLRLRYLRPAQPYSGRLYLHAALVESDVSGNINVVRKLLLTSEGRLFTNTWADTVSQIVTIKTVIDAPIGANNPNLWLAAWAQEDATKTIEQSRMVKLPVRTRTNIVGIEDDPAVLQVRDIVVYPNPASKQFNFAVEGLFNRPVRTEGFTYSIIDQRGVMVQTGALQEDWSEPQPVDIEQLASGMYLVTIYRGGKAVAQHKLVVMHRH